MADIVDRLKYHSGWSERVEHMGPTSDMLWDAIGEIERLRETLTEISRQYENQNVNHVHFRVWAKQVADAALTGNREGEKR